jgi:arsenical pump membrane protein
VLFGGHLPALVEWLKRFALPSVISIVATGGLLFFLTRNDLKERIVQPSAPTKLSTTGKLAMGSIALAIVVLLAASAYHWDLGAPTFAVGALALLLVAIHDSKAIWETPRHVAWSVIPLVAGLFVVVEAVNGAGALQASTRALSGLATLSSWQGDLSAAFGVTALSNVINNLPSGLIAGTAVSQTQVPESLRSALMIGVDLGPNISVTGSLATILWLIALRRERQEISAWSFLKIGLLVTPLPLLLSVLASTWLASLH